MAKHIQYLRYVIRHKWCVFRAGLLLRRHRWRELGLLQLIVHDWTKLLPSEWGPYAEWFYGYGGSSWADTPLGYFERGAERVDEARLSRARAFDYAWLAHQRQRHHWQAWVLRRDDGSQEALEMPLRYVAEMLADWMGAGMAIRGHGLDSARDETFIWYLGNRDLMVLHPNTRLLVEEELGW